MQYTTKCDLCEETQDSSQQEGQYIDYGWSFNWLSLGHYGGFTDPMPDSTDGNAEKLDDYNAMPYMVHVCHDCCVKLLDTFPALAKIARVNGGHPNRNEHDPDNGITVTPCCPYAWTWVRDNSVTDYRMQFTTYFATPELTWVKREQTP